MEINSQGNIQKLLDYFAENNIITISELGNLHLEAKAQNKPITALLREKEIITETELLKIVSKLYKLKIINLSKSKVSKDVKYLLSEKILLNFSCVPVALEGKKLVMAFSMLPDNIFIESIESVINKKIKILLANHHEIVTLINKEIIPLFRTSGSRQDSSRRYDIYIAKLNSLAIFMIYSGIMSDKELENFLED
ncbi:MAG: hypothetical protein ABIA04_12000 [Pseudomonadota bacterium]